MSPSRLLLLALAGLAPFPLPAEEPAATATSTAPAPLPDKVVRFEQMLVRSPGPGRAFDEVFAHYFSSEGVDALRQRWTSARDSAPAGSSTAAAYGLLLGQLAERIGKSDTARARYTEAAAAAPADFRPLHRLGRLEVREGKLPAALAAFEKAAALDMSPADAQDVLRDLARARSRAFDEAGALAAWKDLAARFPDDPLVLEEVGQAQLDAAAYDDAAGTFTALEKAADGDAYRTVLARLRLGEVAARKGDKEAALARFSAALDGTHRDSWLHREAQDRVNALFRQQGDFDGLVAFHEGRLQGASRDPAAARHLAELLLELDRTDSALAWFDKATGWAPDDHELRFAHIRALIAAGRSDDALPLLDLLVKRQPSQPAYREALGQLHWDRAKTSAVADAAATERALALETWAALAPAGASVTELLALAEIYRSHALDEETRATLARALAAEPASYDLRERLALQLLVMDRDDEAWAVARGGDAGLSDPSHFRRLAVLEKRNGLLDPALVSIDRGLTLAPDNYELLDLRWQVLAELTRWDDAIALLPRLLAQAPGDFAVESIENRHVQALRSAEKLDAVLAGLAERVAAEDPALTEADHRLHIRLVLSQAIPIEADAAFAAARKRFPDSFSIAQLEADHRERTAPLEERVAAIRRLIALRPERTTEWLRRLINVYRYEGDFDGARKIVAELVSLAPADAQNHVLAAELEFDAGTPDAGFTALQRALRLASDPAPVRARLARAHLDQNRPAAALELYEEAFYSAPDDNARRAVIAPLTEAAVFANDLDGLLARFVERNRPRRDTAAYYSELGEIHFNAQDFPLAEEAWNRALELNRDNPRLIARLVDLARKNGDAVAVARLLRIRHELDPSPVNAIELGESLLEGDAPAEALELFLAHASYFYTDTSLLPRILPVLAARNLADPLIQRLRAESASAANPADRDFVLATAFIAIRDFPRAEQLLWEVYNRPPAPAPASAPQPTPTGSAPANTATSHQQQLNMRPFQGMQTTAKGFQLAIQLIQSQSGRSGGFHNISHYGNLNLPPSPTETQDTALGYLGALALHQDKASAFLVRLEAELEARHEPASRRVYEFAKVQARDAALRHVKAALAEPSPYLPGLHVASNVIHERDSYTGAQLPLTPEHEALLKAVQDALVKYGPPLSEREKVMMQFHELLQKKDYDAAFALFHELKASTAFTESERRQLAQIELHFRMVADHWDDFLPALRERLASDPTFSGDHAAYVVGSYLGGNEGKAGTTEAERDALASLLLDAYAKPVPGITSVRQRSPFGQSSLQNDLHMIFNYGASIGGAAPGQNYQLQQLASQLEQQKDPLLARLLAIGAQRDPASLLLARTLVFRLAQVLGDTELAESVGTELLKTSSDPGILFNLAEFAYLDNRLDVAKTRYQAVPASSGTLAIAAEARLLEIALSEENIEAAKASAIRLVRMRPPANLPNLDLAGTLRELKLDQTFKAPASPSARRSSIRRDRNEEINRLGNELNTALNKKDHAAAESAARRMLAAAPLGAARNGNDYGRRRALDGFVRAGLIDAYVADLDAQLARSPGSARVVELLAEAHSAIRRQAGNSSGRVLTPVAVSAAPLPLPVRIRLSRKGDTLTASYAPVLFTAPSDESAAHDPTDTSLGYEPAWVELGSVTLADFDNPVAGLTARNQNFRKLSDGRFTDIHFGNRSFVPADFKKRETLRIIDRQSAAFHAFENPLADGGSIELTLDAPSSAKDRIPVDRGLLLRDAIDTHPRVALLLSKDGTLAFTARRHTGRRDVDYLATLVALRPRDEPARVRYVESLIAHNRTADAIEFIGREENSDILLQFVSNDTFIKAHREAGSLTAFASVVADHAVAQASLPGRYPQIDYNVLRFAGGLRESKDLAAAILVWEKIVPLLRDDQSRTVRGELANALLDTNTPESRARALEVVRDAFIPPPPPPEKPALIFGHITPRYHTAPWYGRFSSSNSRLHSSANNLLDSIDDPAFLRALIEENAPRLAAPDVDWESRCYDLALRLRLGDPAAPAVFSALWNDALAAKPDPEAQNHFPGSQANPLAGFLPASLDRFVSRPDPDQKIATIFRSLIDIFPERRNRIHVRSDNPLSTFVQNPWTEFSIRLTWSDYLRAHGDEAGYRQSLIDSAHALERQDPRHINTSVAFQLFGHWVALGDVTEARRFHDTTLRRILRRQGNWNSNNSRAEHFKAMLDALEGKGDAPAPALAAWVAPAADGAAELRWEITARLATDKANGGGSEEIPRIFGHALPSIAAGSYDLIVEFVASDKGDPLARIELPAVAVRGRHRLENVPPATLFRATLRPRAGGEDIVLSPQVFSAQPNLLVHPEPRSAASTTTDGAFHTPGWTLPVPAFTYPGGPTLGGAVVKFIIPPGQQSERLSRSEPIPIDPEKTYLISAWARLLPDEQGQFGLEFIDAAGDPLNNTPSRYVSNDDLRWQRLVLSLGPSSRKELQNRHNIPDKAVALRLWIDGHPGLRLSDIVVQELPSPPDPAP